MQVFIKDLLEQFNITDEKFKQYETIKVNEELLNGQLSKEENNIIIKSDNYYVTFDIEYHVIEIWRTDYDGWGIGERYLPDGGVFEMIT